MSVPDAPSVAPDAFAESDPASRAPLLLLWFCAAFWLLLSSIFGLIASIQLHAPGFLANCSWLTYGHVRAAAENIFLYGFASQAALALILWLFCRTGRTLLVGAGPVFIAALFWNLGVKLGVLGILMGDGTGHEWLEFPRYASPLLFISYLVIAVCALLTFHRRREPALYASQWFLLAAVFWFAWSYSTANLLLVFHPVRGVVQSAVNHWFSNTFAVLWLGSAGLAALFYFIPKISRQPLHSYYTALFGFWTYILFGAWTGIPVASGLPAWISSVSSVAGVFMIVPLYAFAVSWRYTIGRNNLADNPALKYFRFGAIAFLVTGMLKAAAGVVPVNRLVELTHFTGALQQAWLYGFFALTAFGAVYTLFPRLPEDSVRERGNRPQFLCAAFGLFLVVVGLGFAGVLQGIAWRDPGIEFLRVVRRTIPFLGIATLGFLLQMVANGLFLQSVCVAVLECCAGCCGWRSRERPAAVMDNRKVRA